jgi:C4-dicarboxylate-specific signal transduction histidine kinase
VSINEVVVGAVDIVRNDLTKSGIVLKLVQTRGLPYVTVDRVQLQQVVINLIKNAIDAMTGISDRERRLQIRTETDHSGGVMITVEDSGIGLKQDNLDKIFAPFFTTKTQGMGMGLSICRSIIEAHGGKLSAATKPQGAAFEITLPTGEERRHANS